MYKYLLFFLLINSSCAVTAQKTDEIIRIEFNSGSRAVREQIILTPDSIVMVKEDFRIDLRPQIKRRSMNEKDWQALLSKVKEVKINTIDELKAPSDKRTYDAAAHGTLILTTADNKSHTHGFDDEDPHTSLKPLMNEIIKFRTK